jgi:P27 family predicted phage terminase small subunit
MGRPAKPRQMKIAEGNRNKVGKDKIYQEPQGIGFPRLPPGLTEEEEGLWLDTVGSLPDGLLSQADDGALETFARYWALYRQCNRQIAVDGLMIAVKNKFGDSFMRHPLIPVMNQAAKIMNAVGGNLGLSPVARARLASPDRWQHDPLALLLGDDGDPDGSWRNKH